jgi:hypothetical protein
MELIVLMTWGIWKCRNGWIFENTTPTVETCKSVTPGCRGPNRARLTYVIGSSLTHMMSHGTVMNVTSLLYNGVLYKIVKKLHHTKTSIQQP